MSGGIQPSEARAEGLAKRNPLRLRDHGVLPGDFVRTRTWKDRPRWPGWVRLWNWRRHEVAAGD